MESTTNTQPAAPKNKTTVCVLGRLRFDQERVSVGVIAGEETIVQLDKPAKLGNALTVGTWLHDSWATPVDALLVKSPVNGKVGSQSDIKKEDVVKHLRDDLQYPEQATNLLAELFVAPIWITDLFIRRWKENGTDQSAFKFGIAIQFANQQNKDGLTLFGDITLEDVALGIINAPDKYVFPTTAAQLALPDLKIGDIDALEKQAQAAKTEGADTTKVEIKDTTPPASKATGTITFKDNPSEGNSITLNGVAFMFKKTPGKEAANVKIGDTLDETLSALADKLKTSKDVKLTSCEYVADAAAKLLKITAQQSGKEGNAFTLAVDPAATFDKSGDSLQGGA